MLFEIEPFFHIWDVRRKGTYFQVLFNPIAPEKIEGIMGLSPMIAQCLVYGDSLKNSCVSVVIPDEPCIMKWGLENNVQGDFEALC